MSLNREARQRRPIKTGSSPGVAYIYNLPIVPKHPTVGLRCRDMLMKTATL